MSLLLCVHLIIVAVCHGIESVYRTTCEQTTGTENMGNGSAIDYRHEKLLERHSQQFGSSCLLWRKIEKSFSDSTHYALSFITFRRWKLFAFPLLLNAFTNLFLTISRKFPLWKIAEINLPAKSEHRAWWKYWIINRERFANESLARCSTLFRVGFLRLKENWCGKTSKKLIHLWNKF